MRIGKVLFSLIVISILMIIVLFSSVLATDDLLSLQGNIKQAGIDLALGNLTVSVYDAQTAGNLIYNSSNEFNGAIVAGKYDVMLGNSSSNNLSLEYGKLYYFEIFVNNEKFSFNNSGGRQIFQSSTGQINGTYVNSRQINQTHFVYSIDLSNATGFNASFLTGQVSISQLTLGSNIVLSNQSVSFSDDQNITLGNRGWFKGLFNWLIAGNSSHYLSFNGSTLVFDEARLNTTIGNLGVNVGFNNTANIFNQNLNTTNNVRFNNLSIAGNITTGEEIYINGVAVKQWLYNQTLNLYYYNQTATQYFYNQTPSIYYYNQSQTIYYYNQTASPYFYNQSSGTSNIFNQNLNTTNNVLFSDLNVTNVLRVGNTVLQADTSGTLNVTGVANFNGGWRSSGVTISGGNVFAQTLFVYNITSLAVNDLEINGSLIPDLNNTFDVGNITQVYKNIYLSGDQGNIYFGSNSVKQWLYNASQTIYYYNQTATQYFYNQTPSIYYYNQSQTIYYYNQTSSPYFYNQSDGTGSLWQTNGTAIYNATTSQVGIGTATPDALFDVSDQFEVNNDGTTLWGTAGTNYGILSWDTNKATIGGYTSSDLALVAGNSEKVRILSSNGNVGIGTTIPSNKLTVNGTFNVTGGYDTTVGLIVNGSGAVGIGTNAPAQLLEIGADDTTLKYALIDGLRISGDDTGNSIYQQTSGDELAITTNGGAIGFRIKPAGTDNVTIASSGNVGIGETSPESTLDIKGAGTITPTNATNVAPGSIFLFDSTSGGTTNGTVGVFGWQADTGTKGIGSGIGFSRENSADWGSQIRFYTHPPAIANLYDITERMRIDAAGNVGIGTATPTGLLNVKGTGTIFNLSNGTTQNLFVSGTTGYIGIGTDVPRSPLEINNSNALTLLTLSSPLPRILLEDTTSGEDDFTISPNSDYIEFLSGSLRNIFVIKGETASPAGAIGIGTSSPTALLHLYSPVKNVNAPTFGTTVGSIMITPNGTNNNYSAITFGGNNVNARVDTANAGIYVDSSSAYGTRMYLATTNNFATGSQSRLIIDENGKVGINTIIPSNTLTVNGTFNVTGGYDTTVGLIVNGSGAVGIGKVNPNGKLQVNMGTDQNIVFRTFGGETTFEAVNDAFNADVPLRFYATEFDFNGGNVGIGTTVPKALLQINSSGGNGIIISNGTEEYNISISSGTGKLIIQDKTGFGDITINPGGDIAINPGGILEMGTTGTDAIYLGRAFAGAANIGTFIRGTVSLTNATSSQGLYQDGNTNVGIGITNPQSKLNVYNGNVNISLGNLTFDRTTDGVVFPTSAGVGVILSGTTVANRVGLTGQTGGAVIEFAGAGTRGIISNAQDFSLDTYCANCEKTLNIYNSLAGRSSYVKIEGNVSIGGAEGAGSLIQPSNALDVVGGFNVTDKTKLVNSFYVTPTGKVGIGTANPHSNLEIIGASGNTASGYLGVTNANFSLGNDTAKTIFGMGTYANLPTLIIDVAGGSAPSSGLLRIHTNSSDHVGAYTQFGSNGIWIVGGNDTQGAALHVNNSVGLAFARYNSFGSGAGAGNTAAGQIEDANDVYISDDLEVDGTAWLAGGTTWTAGDIAENIHTKSSRNNQFCGGDVGCYQNNTKDDIDFGDLVCIDATEAHTIVKCSEPNSRLAIGVITDTAVLHVGPDAGYPVSLAGIVKAHVTNANGDIMPGDLLVSSSKSGFAMKNNEPRDGTVIGKAFDFCNKDECDIKIFVALS